VRIWAYIYGVVKETLGHFRGVFGSTLEYLICVAQTLTFSLERYLERN